MGAALDMQVLPKLATVPEVKRKGGRVIRQADSAAAGNVRPWIVLLLSKVLERRILLWSRKRVRQFRAAQPARNRRWWKILAMALHIALPNSIFDGLGVPRPAS